MTEETKRTDMADDTTQATRALIEEAKKGHAAGYNGKRCTGCGSLWPCLSSRLAVALEAASKDTNRLVELVGFIHHYAEWPVTPEQAEQIRDAADDVLAILSRAEPDTEEEDTR